MQHQTLLPAAPPPQLVTDFGVCLYGALSTVIILTVTVHFRHNFFSSVVFTVSDCIQGVSEVTPNWLQI